MCQFHQLQIVRRLLTNNPHLPAGIELLALM
ncbi:transposase, partial [Prevotella intermedia]